MSALLRLGQQVTLSKRSLTTRRSPLKFPRDLASVQRGQYHYFYLGNKEGLLQIAEKVLPANRENHYLQGMIAFGLEQCHRLEEAEVAGRRAVEMNRQAKITQRAKNVQIRFKPLLVILFS